LRKLDRLCMKDPNVAGQYAALGALVTELRGPEMNA
jgi:hypothetical protein